MDVIYNIQYTIYNIDVSKVLKPYQMTPTTSKMYMFTISFSMIFKAVEAFWVISNQFNAFAECNTSQKHIIWHETGPRRSSEAHIKSGRSCTLQEAFYDIFGPI